MRLGLVVMALGAVVLAGCGGSASKASPKASPIVTSTPTEAVAASAPATTPPATETPTIATPTVTPTAPPPNPDAVALLAWWNDTGNEDVNQIESDFDVISNAASGENLVALKAGCDALSTDVATIRDDPAPPLDSMSGPWNDMLGAYSDGAQECAEGAGTGNTSLIVAAQSDISNGNDSLNQLSSTVKSMLG